MLYEALRFLRELSHSSTLSKLLISQTKEKSTGCGKQKNRKVSKDISEKKQNYSNMSTEKNKGYEILHLKVRAEHFQFTFSIILLPSIKRKKSPNIKKQTTCFCNTPE